MLDLLPGATSLILWCTVHWITVTHLSRTGGPVGNRHRWTISQNSACIVYFHGCAWLATFRGQHCKYLLKMLHLSQTIWKLIMFIIQNMAYCLATVSSLCCPPHPTELPLPQYHAKMRTQQAQYMNIHKFFILLVPLPWEWDNRAQIWHISTHLQTLLHMQTHSKPCQE